MYLPIVTFHITNLAEFKVLHSGVAGDSGLLGYNAVSMVVF
jgi:hypothetical protein